MNKIYSWIICVAILNSPPILANDNIVRIGGGGITGEYIHIAESLCDAIGKLFICHTVETGGTLDNIKRLENHSLELGLAMANIAFEWLDDPDNATNYTIVRRIIGEAVLVFGKPDTIAAVGSWIGVRENASLLSIGVVGKFSGDASVLYALREIPGSPLTDLQVKTYPNYLELLESVKQGEVKLGFFVQVPNPNNLLFKSIAEYDLAIMGVVDPDMIAFDEVLSVATVTVKNARWFGIAGRAQQVETSLVPIAIVAIKPEVLKDHASTIQQAAIKRILAIPTTELLPQNIGWLQELSNNITLTVGAGLDKVLDTMNSLAVGARERIKRL